MNDDTNRTALVPVKNLGGRPKGKRDSSKRVSPYTKAEAKSLYLAGHLPEDISKVLKISNPALIQKWAREENWDEERAKIMTASSAGMLDNLLKSQLETFRGIQAIKDKSLEHIQIMDVNPNRKYSEVVNAYLSAVDLEYKMKTNTLHARFLGEIANVLKRRVTDRELLKDILGDLVSVYEMYTQKNISSNKDGNDN